MNKLVRLLSLLVVACPSFGQKTEMFLGLNSGLFSFRGASAEPYSMLNMAGNSGYTNNPFGAQNGLSYGLSYQIQRVSKGNFLAGVSIGYENLRSRTTIKAVNVFNGTVNGQEAATGRSNLENKFINGFPYLGYRFAVGQLAVDLTAGVDVGYLFRTDDVGQATGVSGEKYRVSLERSNVNVDVRPRLQLSVHAARIGVYGGYAHGVVNYRSGWAGGINECYAELIRFGVLYKLKG